MHKYFAKTRFLGKKILFLPECHSTNDELIGLLRSNQVSEGTVLFTHYQKKGKGQRGNAWLSEPGKNLLFSFVISPAFLPARQVYLLNIITGLAVLQLLKSCSSKQVELKWPNDVYVNEKKISGILIETVLEGSLLENAIIGVGVNINQRDFYLNTATSLYRETESEYDLEEMLESLLVHFESYYLKLKTGEWSAILHEYYQVMRWRGENRHYKAQGQVFEGEIIGIDDFGRLVVKTDNTSRSFDVKDIEFLY